MILVGMLLAGCGGAVPEREGAGAGQATDLPTAAVTGATAAPATAVSSADLGRIAPSDPHIRYTGRVDLSNPARAVFDWPGVTIEASFEGTSLAVLLEDGRNSYNVTLDGQSSVLQTRAGQRSYPLAQGLRDGTHHVRLTKRTESIVGSAAFLGFELDGGRGLVVPPPPAPRRIEFIGDSITTGYGVEGGSPTCTFSAATQNIGATYAAVTAQALDAEYAVVAFSGLGIVRNYNASDKFSDGTMYSYFQQTLAAKPESLWDFSRWTPDAVVINLGTNDFSTRPHPEGEVFLRGYTDLIGLVRNRYPTAHIFAIGGPVMMDPAEATIQSAVVQMEAVLGDGRVHYVPLSDTLIMPDDYGCDWHPNAAGHQKMADQLIPALRAQLGW